MSTINQRLTALRDVMRREGLSAFIFPSTDPHNSEYTPDHWKGRQWISGFDGSAGTAVVTLDSAALWTDSRYFLAAEEQLRGTEFRLMKLKVEGTPTICEWLCGEVGGKPNAIVGIDGMLGSYCEVSNLERQLRNNGGIGLRTDFDPLEEIWTDRPTVPENKIEIHPLEFAGERASEKIARIRRTLSEKNADGTFITALDDIAWTLNLRGTDVHCNPVFVSYLLLTADSAVLFVDPRKLDLAVTAYLKGEGVAVDDYANIGKALADYSGKAILVDPNVVNYTLYNKVSPTRTVNETSPVPAMKAVKNSAETEGFRRAMTRDGVALVKFLMWLKPAVERGGQTEMSIDRKLTALRAEQELFRDISFDTIAGYEEHGAIVHYEATPDTDAPLEPKGLLLLDSGAQYSDGTTDITRTIALGPLTDEQRKVYTLVLKGHIGLEMLKFPKGASGTQLDAIARKDMWQHGMNFLHGTGHGVGSYLNVHEGPHQIRMEWKPAPLLAGMTVTDEPGLYLAGRFGVRTENTLLVKEYMTTEFGDFLEFEPLTLCPIDLTPVIPEMLSPEERQWLNDYHKTVRDRLSPYLNDEERQWLSDATRAL